jgi:hypothetical protein
MANPLRGEAAIKAGGVDYTLVFDINALCEAEDALGIDTGAILDALAGNTAMKVTRALLWAGLQRHHSCHLLEAGEIAQLAGARAAKAAVVKAIAAAFPSANDKGVAENPPAAADGDGSTG